MTVTRYESKTIQDETCDNIMEKALRPFKGSKFLEVGVGLGRIAKTIMENRGIVTGLDVVHDSL